MNQETLKLLEFDKIIHKIKDFALTEDACQQIDFIKPSTDYSRIYHLLDGVTEANKDKTIITSSQKSLVDMMISQYEETTVRLGLHGEEVDVPISSFFTDGVAEETLCGEINGYKVKTRFDYRKVEKIGDRVEFASINDLKTTAAPMGSATLEDVEEICKHWGYDVSAALYVDLVTQETGIKHDFYFVFMSKKDSVCRIFKASEAMLERGRKRYLDAIEVLKEAEKTGIYFSSTIEELR